MPLSPPKPQPRTALTLAQQQKLIKALNGITNSRLKKELLPLIKQSTLAPEDLSTNYLDMVVYNINSLTNYKKINKDSAAQTTQNLSMDPHYNLRQAIQSLGITPNDARLVVSKTYPVSAKPITKLVGWVAKAVNRLKPDNQNSPTSPPGPRV